MQDLINKITLIDVLQGLELIPDKYIHCCVTSPPYFGLRDYGMEDQIGLEKTPEEYIYKLINIFRQVRRVLKDDGTLWINIGDSYARNGGSIAGGNRKQLHLDGKQKRMTKIISGLKEKDLIGIPWMLAFALRSDGWYLRQDIIWHKPNPMPESVTDRCTKSHEYIFLLSKNKHYYFDAEAISTEAINSLDDQRRKHNQTWDNKNTPDHLRNGIRPIKSGNKKRKEGSERGCPKNNGVANLCSSVPWEGVKANKRSVWTVNTMPYKEAHFATFPEKLVVDMIKAGCPKSGIVLDIFSGAATTALVARKLERDFIAFELNPEYVEISNRRLQDELGMFR